MSNSVFFVFEILFFFSIFLIPFSNDHYLWSATFRKTPYEPIDSGGPRIMFYISPQLKGYSLKKIIKPVNHPSLDSTFPDFGHLNEIFASSKVSKFYSLLRIFLIMLGCVTKTVGKSKRLFNNV